MKRILFLVAMAVASLGAEAQTMDTVSYSVYPDGITTLFKVPVAPGVTTIALWGCRYDDYFILSATPEFIGLGTPWLIDDTSGVMDTIAVPMYSLLWGADSVAVPPRYYHRANPAINFSCIVVRE